MKIKFACYALVFFSLICLNKLSAMDICIPNYYALDSLSYFAEKMDLNIVILGDSLRDKKTTEFKLSFDADKTQILNQFKTANEGDISITYDEKSKTIFCCGKDKGVAFRELLDSEVEYKKPSNYVRKQDGTKRKLKMYGVSEKENKSYSEEIIIKSEAQWKVPCKLSDYLVSLMAEHNFRHCIIETFDDSRSELDKIAKEMQRVNFPSGTERKKEIFEYIEQSKNINFNFIEIFFSYERFSDEPDFGKLARYLQLNTKIVNKRDPRWLGNPEFWIVWYMTFSPQELLQYLFENDLFDKTTESRLGLIYMVPSVLVLRKDKKGVEFTLQNLGKVVNNERKRYIIDILSAFDKSLLDEKSAQLLFSYGKEFGIESLYLDTSKWIGDDLPEDYDRWKNFKIPETELSKEEKVTVDGNELLLRYYRYKEPFRIGGIPLKKFEETDWSTPEKAYISSSCARNNEWRKASLYEVDNIPISINTVHLIFVILVSDAIILLINKHKENYRCLGER